jgi:putative ABC transport system ATP-binding protein
LLLSLTDVIKLYKPENERLQVPALRGVDLDLDKGEIISVIGPSGSGKSTLIKMIGAIDTPSSGKIEMEGVGLVNNLIGKQLNWYRKEKVGFLYQFPERNLFPALTAFENVEMPIRLMGKLNREQRMKRVNELLDAVGLLDRKKNKPGQLSGGEAQRTSIAVALANNPTLILADEPTGELDSDNTFKIINYFKKINQQFGTSFIVVTHDERFAKLTKNTYKIRDGRIYGMHRRVKTNSGTSLQREHILFVDRHGNLRLPEDLLERAGIKKHVIVKYNNVKNVLEVIPVKEQDIEN